MTDSPDNRNALPIDYQLGDYQIQRLLGDGGFGITYLAIDMRLNSKVALKEYFPNELAIRENNRNVYPKSQRDSQDFAWGLQRFLEEAQTLAKFKHLNIVRVLRFFETNHTAYIVMEYEQGESLASALEDGNTATESELLTIMRPLLDGLATIHQAGVLHRDIKPANIYLRHKDNSPVLLDFGSARYDVGSRSRSVTSIVTPGYAPLEQYETKGHQGAWTDIYALGAVMYRAIGGERPVEATERTGAILRGKPDPLTPAVEIGRGHYSPHLLEAIDWALKVNEDDRPSSVEAWRAKLLAMPAPLTSRRERSPSEQPTERMTSRPDFGWKHRRILAVGVALLLAIMVGGSTYYFIDSQADSQARRQARRQTEVEAKLAAAEEGRRQAEAAAKLAAAEHARLQAETRLAEVRAATKQLLRLEREAAQAAAEQLRLEREAAQAAAEQARRERETAFAKEIARRQTEARRAREAEQRRLAAQITRRDIKPVFKGFLKAWNNKQHYRLMSYLSSDFYYVDHKRTHDYHEYAANKRKFFEKYRWLSVTVSNIRYSFNGNEGSVTYHQHFNSPTYESNGTNKFYFRKRGGETKIFKEEFERDWYQIKKTHSELGQHRNVAATATQPPWCPRALVWKRPVCSRRFIASRAVPESGSQRLKPLSESLSTLKGTRANG